MIVLDTDEAYDTAELRKDIEIMHREGIETLYSPIRTFYNDVNHYFDDSYYVPTVYKINGRKFRTLGLSNSVICDPARQLVEGRYMISTNPMKHYCYLKELYAKKIRNHVMTGGYMDKFEVIANYLATWKDGMPALAFTNDGTDVVLSHIPLKKI